MAKRYAVVTDTKYTGHAGKLAWTSSFAEAYRIALALGGKVVDADAFAANPDPNQHEAVTRGH